MPSRPEFLPKPLLRGRLHQFAFFVAIPAGAALVAVARGSTARGSAVVYAVSLGVSSPCMAPAPCITGGTGRPRASA
jgi:hypothetical protein